MVCSSRVTYDSYMRFESELLRGKASVIAKQYGVSPKTIRDIWNHKTWYEATFRLWDPRFFNNNDNIVLESPMSFIIEEATNLNNESNDIEIPDLIDSNEIFVDPFHDDWNYW